MKIVVCQAGSRHGDPDEDRRRRQEHRDRGHHLDLSPYDEFAVEEALRIKEKRGQGEVVAISLGPDRVEGGPALVRWPWAPTAPST